MNFSLISLTLHQISTSPFISLTPTLNNPDYTFQSINIFYSFQSFLSLWTQFPNYFGFIYVKNSGFSKFLSSAIYINNDVSKEVADMKYTTQNEFITQIGELAAEIRVEGCCFSECRTNAHQHGGALYLKGESWTSQTTFGNLSNCAFYKCYSGHNGSAIYIDGRSLVMENMEFSNCETAEFGVIYYESGTDFKTATFNYVDINHCKGNSAISALPNTPNYDGVNITSCENNIFHDATSPDQYPSAFLLRFSDGTSSFQFFNLIENSGDFVFKYDHEVSYNSVGFNSINIISNKKVNRIFEFEVSYSLQMNDFYIFDNQAASAAGVIPIYGDNSNEIVTFTNSFFDLPEATVKSNCNKCQFNACAFDVSNIQTVNFAYMQNYQFLNPFSCIPRVSSTDFFSYSSEFSMSNTFTISAAFSHSFVFSLSSSFSKSQSFSKSYAFSDSNGFPPSSSFLPTSQFTKTRTFTPTKRFSMSEIFSKSFTFSDSSVFTPSSKFTSTFLVLLTTSPFTPTSDNATSPFTPSDSFTPSNFFTPNRTKFPDGLNRLEQADVRSENNMFSKEELKKAAAPASISLILIIVTIVMTIFYVKRKMKEVLNRDNIPDFDVEDSSDDSTYSYSFYTYDYYYSDELSKDRPLKLQQSRTAVGTCVDLLSSESEYASYSEFTDENLDIEITFDEEFRP